MSLNIIENTFAQGQINADIGLFNQAMVKGKRARIFSMLRNIFRQGTNRWEKSSNIDDKPVRLLRVQSVLINKIKPNEMKDKNFDQDFYPIKKLSQHRWMSIARARMKNVSIPAVELLKVGDRYVVLDGHHRISVAKALGESYIDAKIKVW